ncbi:hypothetical protein Q5692_32890 [Microcoleus sp. C2C3]
MFAIPRVSPQEPFLGERDWFFPILQSVRSPQRNSGERMRQGTPQL